MYVYVCVCVCVCVCIEEGGDDRVNSCIFQCDI